MADNMNQDPNQDPFAHPIKRNNWWLYIFGGIVMAGIIIWFFINWAYKNRDKEPIPVENQVQEPPVSEISPEETLPTVTVEGQEGGQE